MSRRNGSSDLRIRVKVKSSPAVASFQSQIAGLAVRRAFRYADAKSMVSLKASAVEPDVRVETQDTVSLGEDRTVLVRGVRALGGLLVGQPQEVLVGRHFRSGWGQRMWPMTTPIRNATTG